jgi:hypothetical protein
MTGFAKPQQKRRYWLQIHYRDGREVWKPSYKRNRATFDRAARLIEKHGDTIAFIVVLDGHLPKGAVAQDHHIIHDLQPEYVDDAALLKH